MLRYLTVVLLALLIGYYAHSQISINTTGNPPNISAMVDITSTNRGLLIPRMTQAQRDAIGLPGAGLLIYQTTTPTGFYYNAGNPLLTLWTQLMPSSSGWHIVGNSGINPSTMFVGTTDSNALNFRINNIRAGQLDPETGNAFFGLRTGLNNSTGFSNIAIGAGALFQNTVRNNLVAIGDSALFNNGIGAIGTNPASGNTAVGSKSLFSNNTGFFNSGHGFQSLINNTSGSNNVAVGYQSLFHNTTGSNNTASGASSLSSNINGIDNTGTGSQSLFSNTIGNDNTASGYRSLFSNTAGERNAATGFQALYSNTTGQGNTADGSMALFSNSTGNSNIAIGIGALYSSTDRNELVAVGDSALFSNGIGAADATSATANTAIGTKTLFFNRLGNQNTAIGYESLFKNDGSANTAIGYKALFDNRDGIQNTATGGNALVENLSGSYNVATGYATLNNNLSGNLNTAIGVSALKSMVEGVGNTGIGMNADVVSIYSFSTVIGYNAFCLASNVVRVGDMNVTSIGGFAGWTNFSDGRFKKNVLDNVPGLSFIQQLRPISYTLDLQAIEDFIWPGNSRYARIDANLVNSLKSITEASNRIKEKIVYTGFVAQEVEATAKKLGFDFSGVDAPKNERDLYGLRYAEFVVPLVKAVQELAEQNARLNENTSSQLLIIQEQNKKIESLMQQNEKLQKQIVVINKKLNIE